MKAYFFCDHPFDLVMFAGLKNILKKDNPNLKTTLIVTENPYYKRCQGPRFYGFFDEVIPLNYCHYRLNVVRGYPAAIRFKNSFEKIPFAQGSTVFLSSTSQLVTNIAVSHLRKNGIKTVLLRQSDGFVDGDQEFKSHYKLSFVEMVKTNLYSTALGLHWLQVYRNRGSKIVMSRVYRDFPFDFDFILKNSAYDTIAGENQVFFPFYFDQKESSEITKAHDFPLLHEKPLVIYFGSRFLSWDFVDKKVIAEKISSYLRKIAEAYPDCNLIYKPHPMETGEKDVLDLRGYHVVDNLLTAEMLFAMYQDIRAVYSIGSTASKSAMAFGFNSYVFYEKLGYTKAVLTALDSLFAGFPRENRAFHEDKIKEYAVRDNKDSASRVKQYRERIETSAKSMLERVFS